MKKNTQKESDTSRRSGKSPLPTIARVDLLPPIVEVRRRQSATLRLLTLGLGGLIVIALAGSVATAFLANGAESALADEQDRNARLVDEQAEYAEVSNVKAQLIDYDLAEFAALFAETDWARLMRELDLALPRGVELTSEAITLKGITEPSTNEEVTGLDTPGIIEITFTASAEVFDSPTPLLNSLQSLTGYASATVDAVAGGREDGYVITGVVQLSSAALGSKRSAAALDADQLAILHQALSDAVTLPPVVEETTEDETTDDAATEE